MAQMLVFNLTDVSTPGLEQRDLVNKTLAVYDTLLGPGEVKSIEGTDIATRDAKHYEGLGALAIGRLPPAYVTAKARMAVVPVVSKVARRKRSK